MQAARLGLLLLGGVLGTVFLVAALMAAAQSLEPYVDTPRTFYAAMADLSLAAGAGLLVVAMMGFVRAGAWRRVASHYGLSLYAGAAVLVALPLMKAATNDAYSSSIGAGGTSLGLIGVGAAGLVVGVGLLVLRRVPLELVAATALPLALLVVAVLRDTS